MFVEIVVNVSFLKHTLTKMDTGIVEGDYNTTKFIFNFEEDVSEGQIFFKMSNPAGEPILIHQLTSPEVVLSTYDADGNPCSLFDAYGLYPFELVWYCNNGKITSAPGWMSVSKRQVPVSDGTVPHPEEMFSEYVIEVNTLLGGDLESSPTALSVKEKMHSLIDTSNNTTGRKDADLTSGIHALIAGYDVSGGITPKGSLPIAKNGIFDVTNYAEAEVRVPIPEGYLQPMGVCPIFENGNYDIAEYEAISVNVPNSPTGTKEIFTNGTFDVTNYAEVIVRVPEVSAEEYDGEVSISGVAVISFKIGDTTYYALENFSWGDWANSSYNTDNFIARGDNIVQSYTMRVVCEGTIPVLKTDLILEGFNYVLGGSL